MKNLFAAAGLVAVLATSAWAQPFAQIGSVPAAGVVSGDGSSISNVINVFGQTGDINLGLLPNLTTNLMAGTKPMRILVISDLTHPGTQFGYQLIGKIGWAGSMGSSILEEQDDNSGGALAQDSAIWPFTGSVWSGAAGNTYTFRRSATVPNPQGNLTDTNFYGDNAMVAYAAYTNGGTFLVQTSYNGGAWATLQTINSAAFGTNVVVTNFALPIGYYSLRVNGSSGTSKVILGGVYDMATNGVTMSLLSISGGTDIATFPTSSYTNVFNFWNPNLIVLMDTDGPRVTPYWSQIVTAWRNMCPGADIVGEYNHYTGVDTNPEGYNAQLRTNAIALGIGLFDTYSRVGTNITALVNQGLMNADKVHYLSPMAKALDSALYQAVVEPVFSTMDNGGYRQEVVRGPGLLWNSTGNGTTNWTGLGTTTPRARLDINDVHNLSNDHVMLGSALNGLPALWLQSDLSVTPQANNTNYLAASGGGALVLNYWNGQYVQILENGDGTKTRLRMYTGGGTEIGGNTGNDPGLGNLAIVGRAVANRFSTSTNTIAVGFAPNLNTCAFEVAKTNTGPLIFAQATLPTDATNFVVHELMVVNTGASDQSITFPAPYRTNIAGTVMRCTNVTYIRMEYLAGFCTNVFCQPRF